MAGTVRAGVGMLALVGAIACGADEPDGGTDPAGSVVVSCTGQGIDLSPAEVVAQPDGVHVAADAEYAGTFLRHVDGTGFTGA